MSLFVAGLVLISFYSCTTDRKNQTIKGRVFETDSLKPLSQVTIILKHQDSTMLSEQHFAGTISDSLGYFELRYNGEIEETAMYIGKTGYEALFIKDLSHSKALKKYFLKPDTAEHIDYIPNY